METINNLSIIVNLALETRYLTKLTVHQEEGIRELRPNIHVFLRADSCSFKSTVLKEIENHINKKLPLEDRISTIELITGSGLIGTIDKDRNIIAGEAWRARNKALLLDEFNVEGKDSCTAPLLSVLEDQKYKKSIGRFANDLKEEDGDLFFEVKKGQLMLKTRFPCFIASMKNVEKSHSDNIEALLGRCIVYPYSFSNEELKDIVRRGKRIFTLNNKGATKPFSCDVKRADYEKIVDFVDNYPQLDHQNQYARIVGDCCRAFAVNGKKHMENHYFLITKLHQDTFKRKK